MDINDPFLIITAIAVVATAVAPLASRLIAAAAARLSTEIESEPSPDLSRIRRRNRR